MRVMTGDEADLRFAAVPVTNDIGTRKIANDK
jgi:hypothetical protein